MKKIYLLIVSMVTCLCMLVGCGSQNGDFSFVEEEQSENPFEQEDGNLKTTVMGTISHGVLWGDNNTYSLTYGGGRWRFPILCKAPGLQGIAAFLFSLTVSHNHIR